MMILNPYMLVGAPSGNIFPEVRFVTTQSYNSTTHAIGSPGSSSTGDLMFVQIILDGNGTISTPSGWTQIISSGLVNGVNARVYVYRRIKQEGDASSLTLTSTTSTRSALIGWSIKVGTFNPAVDPTVTAAVGTDAAPNPTSVTNPSGAIPALVTAIMAADVRPSVTSFPLAGNNTQMLSSATPGVTAAICTQTTTAASFDPAAFAINASVEWLAGTILVRGFAA
jgi:hypothetical protein